MAGPGPVPDVTPEDVQRVFAEFDDPSTPLTTAEVARRLDCEEAVTERDLVALADRSALRTRQLDDERRVWWRASDGGQPSAEHSDLTEFGAFVSAVEEYAIFMLDPDGVVTSWNEGAQRTKGYDAEEIVGEHFSTFYTDADVAEGVPERNLETAATAGAVEDEGWRVRKDGSRFWANVTITEVRDDDGTLRGFTKVTRDMTERREHEQQLREERDVTERILDTVPVSICVVEADGKFARANRRMLERIGATESELREYSVDSWTLYDVDGEPIPADERPWRRVLETGTAVYDVQGQVELPGVGRRWLSVNAAPLVRSDRNDQRVVVSVEDVTEHREHERQLRREHEQTEKLLRTAPIPIAVQDAEGETVMANQRAQELLGLSEREFIEEPADIDEWGLYDADGEPIPPEETPSARVLATGEPVLDEAVTIDPPTGDQIQLSVNAAPLFDADGSIDRVVTAGEDITELKRRERQLEQHKSELETELSEILGRISDAFYALDEEWQFTHLNDHAAEIMGYPIEELLGRTVWEAFPDAREGGVYWEQLHEAMAAQEPLTFEVYEESNDSWLEFNVYPSASGLSIYFRDVTERKEYERKLEESNERLEQFAYAASHDLQEPLRMVSSYLQLIENRYTDDLDDDGREFIDFAVDGADRMRTMIEGLLEYSRVETQGDPFERVALDSVFADVLDDLQVRIEEADAEIVHEPLPVVDGDAGQLRQLFQNLLDNAIEYSGEAPPSVEVTAERETDAWRISVHDEGIGIAPADAQRVFDVFQRLHSQAEHAGTGIGLALAERIVERHGGEIWVDSEPGEGTTFSFTLPTVDDAPQ
ncbi:PAS domain-containing sensor histidine kinase [Halobacterium wangiae]|uniref:PAS domain-containing sensor histidine kinase n=1 Tax=Halobacterium wangiae TaxID=2902623 RepID=UPI001E3F9187|nr:PAS domain S-box protein [Halobacterium wangiae]